MSIKSVVSIGLCGFLFACRLSWRHPYSDEFLHMPNDSILLSDSTTVLSLAKLPATRPRILFYFSPDCEFCQDMTEYFIKNISMLKDVDIVFISNAPLKELNAYRRYFKLDQYANVHVANDYKYQVFETYKVKLFPYIIIYNKQQQLTKLYEGEVRMDRLLNAINSSI